MEHSALDEPWVRSVLRRRTWIALGMLAGGAGMLVAFVLLANHYSADSAALRSHGARAVGHVVAVREDTRYSEGAATVAFAADGRSLAAEVDLGADASSYSVGQQVQVYYEAANPNHMTIDDEDNQPTNTVLPMILLLVFGALLFVIGAVWAAHTQRTRAVLAHTPWQFDRAEIVSRGSGRGARAWLIRSNEPDVRFSAPWPKAEGRHVSVAIAQRGRRAVVAVPAIEQLRAGRIPRRYAAWRRQGP